MADIAPEGQQPTPTTEHQSIWAKVRGVFGGHKPIASNPIAPTPEQPMATSLTPTATENAEPHPFLHENQAETLTPTKPATPLKS